jgi:hypothetical protein
MRSFSKAFLSCVAVAAMGMLFPSATLAHGHSYSCSSFNPTVTILAGPCPVTSATPTECAPSGDYTGIKYQVTGNPDHVATVVTANNVVVSVPGNQFYAACAGDPVTGLGAQSCHERAVKVNPDAYTGEFWLVVEKSKGAVLESIVAKKGSCVKPFAIAGLGYDVNPFAATQKTETVNFKGCAVTFVRDILTGAVLSAALDPDQSTLPLCHSTNASPCCSDVIISDVDKLSLSLNVPGVGDLGTGQIGDGYISSGENSCTTRVIGGRVYTWGSPCPQ